MHRERQSSALERFAFKTRALGSSVLPFSERCELRLDRLFSLLSLVLGRSIMLPNAIKGFAAVEDEPETDDQRRRRRRPTGCDCTHSGGCSVAAAAAAVAAGAKDSPMSARPSASELAGPDLSHLTEEERKIILGVLQRQRDEEAKDKRLIQ